MADKDDDTTTSQEDDSTTQTEDVNDEAEIRAAEKRVKGWVDEAVGEALKKWKPPTAQAGSPSSGVKKTRKRQSVLEKILGL